MDYPDKEVRFDLYCKTCKYCDTPGTEDPCNECLEDPFNYETEKPMRWKEKKK